MTVVGKDIPFYMRTSCPVGLFYDVGLRALFIRDVVRMIHLALRSVRESKWFTNFRLATNTRTRLSVVSLNGVCLMH